ncbi:MAG: AMP-binding protein [Scytonema sp. CRU_2_7]|nr:AMP-binding protein [Scytonema sp. CRU_2_7]
MVFHQQQLTYQELNTRANQLAHHLQALGVGPDVLVAICVERSWEMLVGILGILKAGGAYVPIDPTYPNQRLVYMLENSQVSVILTQEQLVKKLPDIEAQVLCLETLWDAIAQESDENPKTEVIPDNLAYLIYTSGSTGQPKGVQVTHQNLVHSTTARICYYINL